MTTLSELFPVGGGGLTADFVASGTLPNGKAVILNSNGTVSLPANQSLSASSQAAYQTGQVTRNALTYDSGKNKLISAFTENTGTQGLYAQIGVLSGSSITWQTRVIAYAADHNPGINPSVASDDNGTFVIAFDKANGTSSLIYVVVGTISGNTVTMGTPVSLGTSQQNGLSVAYDANAAKFIVFYTGVSDYGTGVVLSISGTTPTVNTPVVFRSAAGGKYASAYDSVSQKVGLFYYKDTANISGQAVTISGTTPSYGTAANLVNVIATESYMQPDGAFDSDTGQCVFVFRQDNGHGIAVTMKISGTSSSFGTGVQFTSGSDRCQWPSVSYDTLAKKVVIINDTGDNNKGDYILGSVSGTAIAVDAAVEFTASSIIWLASVFDSTAGKSVFTYSNVSISDDGYYVVLANAVQNVSDFVGITTEAIASGTTGTVTVSGGVSTNQSSLTIGSTYYVQADGTISTVSTSPAVLAGEAVSATSLLLNGLDEIPSQSGNTGKFLTTDGSSASWGTVGGSQWEYISTTTATAASTVDFETFSSSYVRFMITFTLQTSQSTDLYTRIKTNGVYHTTEAQHDYVFLRWTGGTPSWSSVVNQNKIDINGGGMTGLRDNTGAIFIEHPNSTAAFPFFTWELTYPAGSESFNVKGLGVWSDGHTGLQGLRFLSGGGTITGSFNLYGFKTS